MSDTSIQWTDKVWNCVTGCTKVSPGCKHCYAEGVAERFWATQYPMIPIGAEGTVRGERPRLFTDVQCHEDRLLEPLKWRKPARVFVNSMSDLFHEDVPDVFIDRVFAVMADAGRHTFQILTKRPERMLAYLSPENSRYTARKVFDVTSGSAGKFDCDVYWPLRNVWLGVSVENQHFADERIPLLLQTPAAVRFVSAEPLLGPVNLQRFPFASLAAPGHTMHGAGGLWFDALKGVPGCPPIPRLDWVICGGESGPSARPMDLAWARSIVQQCKAAGVSCFVKQVGAHPYDGYKGRRIFLRDRKGGNPEEWPSDLQVREWPA